LVFQIPNTFSGPVRNVIYKKCVVRRNSSAYQ